MNEPYMEPIFTIAFTLYAWAVFLKTKYQAIYGPGSKSSADRDTTRTIDFIRIIP